MRTNVLIKSSPKGRQCVCGWLSSVTVCSFVSPSQELSSSTPAWLCWVSSSSTAACRRPKPGVWRRSKRCSKTSSVPAAPPIRTRDGRSNTSESKVQTTIYRTTTHLTWTRECFSLASVITETCRVSCDIFLFFFVCVWAEEPLVTLATRFRITVCLYQKLSEVHFQFRNPKSTTSQGHVSLFSELRVNWCQIWGQTCFSRPLNLQPCATNISITKG